MDYCMVYLVSILKPFYEILVLCSILKWSSSKLFSFRALVNIIIERMSETLHWRFLHAINARYANLTNILRWKFFVFLAFVIGMYMQNAFFTKKKVSILFRINKKFRKKILSCYDTYNYKKWWKINYLWGKGDTFWAMNSERRLKCIIQLITIFCLTSKQFFPNESHNPRFRRQRRGRLHTILFHDSRHGAPELHCQIQGFLAGVPLITTIIITDGKGSEQIDPHGVVFEKIYAQWINKVPWE